MARLSRWTSIPRPKPAESSIKPADRASSALLGALLGGANRQTFSSRDALITAAGDSAVEAIFRFLGNPAEAQKFKDKRVLFGVAMVAVNPGWRTRKGYAADIAVTTHYVWKPARLEVIERLARDPRLSRDLQIRIREDCELGGEDNPAKLKARSAKTPRIPAWLLAPTEPVSANPLVAAVSPMTEVQALELRSRDSRREELALKLAFALRYLGLGAEAELFERSIERHAGEARTRTPGIAVNAYSSSGGMFGYQVGPELWALEKPARGDSGPGSVLERQTFPVLLIFALDDEELRPRLSWRKGRLEVLEPQLMLIQSTRWLPLAEGAAQRLSETERLRWSRELARVPEAFATAAEARIPAATRRLIDARLRVLRFHAFGSSMSQPLPVEVIFASCAPPAGKS